MKQKLQPLVIILAMFLGACATILPGNDPVVVNAQRAATSAHQIFDGLFAAHSANKAYLQANAPAVYNSVQAMKPKVKVAETELWTSIEVYRQNRTVENKASLNTYLLTLQALVNSASSYLSQINATTP